MKSTNLNIRTDKDVKMQAEKLLKVNKLLLNSTALPTMQTLMQKVLLHLP